MIKVKIDAQHVIDKFQRMTDLSKDFRPLFEKMAGKTNDIRPWTVRGGYVKSFMSKTDPTTGSSWAPLKDQTLKYKQRKYGTAMATLVASGNLFESLTGANGDTVDIRSERKFIFGTKAPYGTFHQFGTSNIPRRRFSGISELQRRKWNALIKAYLCESVQNV